MTFPVIFKTRFRSAGLAYSEKLLATQTASLIGYWPLNEASGTTADNAEGTADRDATYSSDVSGWPVGTGIGDGNTAPTFDGTNDYADHYTTSIRDAFDKDTGTVMIWGKVSSAGIWTAGDYRWCVSFRADSDNNVQLFKTNAAGNNELIASYKAGGTTTRVDIVTTTTDWFHLAITWNVSSDVVKVYFNGSQTGGDQSGLGSWSGNIAVDNTKIGAFAAVPTYPWDGWLAHLAIWTTDLSAAEVATLATV